MPYGKPFGLVQSRKWGKPRQVLQRFVPQRQVLQVGKAAQGTGYRNALPFFGEAPLYEGEDRAASPLRVYAFMFFTQQINRGSEFVMSKCIYVVYYFMSLGVELALGYIRLEMQHSVIYLAAISYRQ